MSEESSGGSSLKNAIIGFITILVTALAGVIGKKVMGDDEATTPPPAAAPAININLENNVKAGGGSGGAAAPAPAPKKKDDWTKAEPKW